MATSNIESAVCMHATLGMTENYLSLDAFHSLAPHKSSDLSTSPSDEFD